MAKYRKLETVKSLKLGQEIFFRDKENAMVPYKIGKLYVMPIGGTGIIDTDEVDLTTHNVMPGSRAVNHHENLDLSHIMTRMKDKFFIKIGSDDDES